MENKMAIRIDGKKISQEIKDELKAKVAEDKAAGKTACLAVIQVGADPASSIYVRNKKNACAYIGIESLSYELPETTTEEELLTLIGELNQRDDVNGILCQLPVPKHIREDKIIKAIDPKKDVDGFHPENVGALLIGQKGYISCTPAGIIQLLKRSGIEIEGKHCVVVGRSNIVGKPMAILMLRENATVTIAHSRTKNLKEICKEADILIAAIGKPKFIYCRLHERRSRCDRCRYPSSGKRKNVRRCGLCGCGASCICHYPGTGWCWTDDDCNAHE